MKLNGGNTTKKMLIALPMTPKFNIFSNWNNAYDMMAKKIRAKMVKGSTCTKDYNQAQQKDEGCFYGRL